MSDDAHKVGWIRALYRSTSTPIGFVVAGAAALIVLTVAATQMLIPTDARRHWLNDHAFSLLSRVPPADVLFGQLPPERLASVRRRIDAMVAKADRPAAAAASIGSTLAAAGFVLATRFLRPKLGRLAMAAPLTRLPTPSWPRSAYVVAGAALLAGLAVHWPYATASIRYDEDVAALQAANGWWQWANNVVGWQVHVAAMLCMRLSTAAFGLNAFAVRLPAVLASSLALAALGGFLSRRYRPIMGVLTVAMIVCVPMWAEQTSLARGYGLGFAAGTVLLIALVRLYDEGDRPKSSTVVLLLSGIFVGALSHFFFLFAVVGVVVLIITSRRLSADTRFALGYAVALALAVPALSFAVGLPSIVFYQATVAPSAWHAVYSRFLTEFAFRQTGALGTVLASLTALALIGGIIRLPRPVRRYALVLIAFGVGLPAVAKPVNFFPRFFLHLGPMFAAAMAWVVVYRTARLGPVFRLGVLAVCAGLLAITKPWSLPVFVDLRQAAAVAAIHKPLHQDHFAVDVFIASGVRFYQPELDPRIVNVTHPLPDDVEWLLVGATTLSPELTATFDVSEQWHGTEHTIFLLRRKPFVPAGIERTPPA